MSTITATEPTKQDLQPVENPAETEGKVDVNTFFGERLQYYIDQSNRRKALKDAKQELLEDLLCKENRDTTMEILRDCSRLQPAKAGDLDGPRMLMIDPERLYHSPIFDAKYSVMIDETKSVHEYRQFATAVLSVIHSVVKAANPSDDANELKADWDNFTHAFGIGSKIEPYNDGIDLRREAFLRWIGTNDAAKAAIDRANAIVAERRKKLAS
jgi:hypothetical protein